VLGNRRGGLARERGGEQMKIKTNVKAGLLKGVDFPADKR
jgi:hypothetical protein